MKYAQVGGEIRRCGIKFIAEIERLTSGFVRGSGHYSPGLLGRKIPSNNVKKPYFPCENHFR